MKPFELVRSVATPLLRDNVDTDLIIRIDRLTSLNRESLGKYAFEAIRFTSTGSVATDCVLNQPAYGGSSVLLAGKNFGCGSSREGAVWALDAYGFKCVIAESFGDIFYSNCFQSGVLPIVLAGSEIQALAASARSGQALLVDLQTQIVSLPDALDGREFVFQIDRMKKLMLLDGVTEFELALQRKSAIAEWQKRDQQQRPWVWESVRNSQATETEGLI